MKNEFTGCAALFLYNVKNALFFNLHYFSLLQQDSEKIRRLRNAIDAQTNYTIKVSISKQFFVTILIILAVAAIILKCKLNIFISKYLLSIKHSLPGD